MNLSVQREKTRDSAPDRVRTRVPGTDEIGTIVQTKQVKSGPYLGKRISTVLFESTGECRLYLDDRLDKLKR